MVMVGAGTPNALGTGTDSNGRYELTGVKGTQTLEISAPGYATVSRTITVDRNMTTDVEIVPTQTPAAIAGRWRVTFEPNSACSSWPTAVGARTYQADITQQRTHAVFTFSGATFEGQSAFDFALVVGNDLRLEIGTWGESGLIEHTSDGQFVRIRGVVTAVVAGSRIEGDLDGILDLAPTLAGLDQGTSCAHAHHHVIFTR
jgi:hypothetical protein